MGFGGGPKFLFFWFLLGVVFRLKTETCLLVLKSTGFGEWLQGSFFFLVPLGGVFRLKLETCLLFLEKYRFWGWP